jgi:4-phosphopantoate--beta-alanine ligase
LKAIEKFVITIDLNPMSRTSVYSDITIVDNIVRAAPLMVQYAREMKDWPSEKLNALVASFDNRKNLNREVSLMRDHLSHQIDTTYKGDEP